MDLSRTEKERKGVLVPGEVGEDGLVREAAGQQDGEPQQAAGQEDQPDAREAQQDRQQAKV